MTTTAPPDSASTALGQQHANRIETGYGTQQLAEFVEKASLGWREHDQVPVLVLRALCRLVARSADHQANGCTALELVMETRAERPQWSVPRDKNDASRRIAKYWDTLGELFAAKAEHLDDQLRVAGHIDTLRLHKDQGGGQGLTSRYRLLTEPLPAVDRDTKPPVASDRSVPPPTVRHADDDEIRYAPEDSALHRGLSARLAAGIEMTGWARRVFVGSVVLFTTALLASCLILIGLVLFVPRPALWLSFLALMVAGTSLVWIVLLPPFRISIERILKAPFWIEGLGSGWLLEWRCPPLHPRKSMHRVRYTGTCPVCAGRVDVDQEAWWLPANRLIGRCENAPRAHRYSFDHVARRGRRL